MKPEEVPADLIRIATEGLMGCEVRGILANAIPEIQRREREQAVAEIAAKAEEFADTRTGPRASFRRGLLAAARHIAPKLTPQEIAEAIANGDAVFCNPSKTQEKA